MSCLSFLLQTLNSRYRASILCIFFLISLNFSFKSVTECSVRLILKFYEINKIELIKIFLASYSQILLYLLFHFYPNLLLLIIHSRDPHVGLLGLTLMKDPQQKYFLVFAYQMLRKLLEHFPYSEAFSYLLQLQQTLYSLCIHCHQSQLGPLCQILPIKSNHETHKVQYTR